MAEETPVVQNWPLLIVAAVLGLVVAVVYNFHISQVKEGARGEMVWLLQVKKDLRPGEAIKTDYIEKVEVPKSIADNLGNVMKGDAYSFAIEKVVNSSVQKGNYLTYADITQDSSSARPSMNLAPGMIAFEVPLEPRLAPGEMLRVGDHVNIMGTMTVDTKRSNYWIMEGARVVGIGGHVARDPNARAGLAEGQVTFRSITIEIAPKVAKDLANVLTHATNVTAFPRNPGEDFPASPQLSPDVAKLAGTASGGGGAGGMPRPE